MQLITLRPSKTRIIFASALYALFLLVLWLVNFPLWLKLVLSASLVILLVLDYRKIYLKTTNSVLALRVQTADWQIKTQNTWHKVKLVKSTLISDLVLFLAFKDKNQSYHLMLTYDSLDADSFKKLRLAIRLEEFNNF